MAAQLGIIHNKCHSPNAPAMKKNKEISARNANKNIPAEY
jgi:hypothetical protein